jgi:steroid delta-isomerase-like uncharacterized protein
MSNSKEIGTLARRFMDAMDGNNWDQILELVDPEVRVGVGGHDLDRDAFLGMGRMFMAAFPDGTHEVQDLIVAGDQVIIRKLWKGTHQCDFQGIPATGRSVAMKEITIERWVDGRMTEHYSQFDSLGLMQQLGVIPGAAAA